MPPANTTRKIKYALIEARRRLERKSIIVNMELLDGDYFLSENLAISSKEFREAKDTNGATYLEAYQRWCKTLDELEYVVISIGSGGNDSQQRPKFAYAENSGLMESQVVTLNLDPSFCFPNADTDEARLRLFHNQNHLLREHISVMHAPIEVEKQSFPKTHDALAKAISGWIQQGKKVILIDSQCPNPAIFHEFYPNLIKPHLDHLNSKFVFVHSYHDFNPVWIYQRAFYDAETAEQSEIILSGFFIKDVHHPLRNDDAKAMTQTRQAAKGYAVGFRSIDDLPPIADLFPEDAVQARPPIAAGNPFHHPSVGGGEGNAADANQGVRGQALSS